MSIEAQVASPLTGKRLALLVGVNGESPTPGQEPLKYAIDDAKAMAQVLQEDACHFRLIHPPLLGEQATTDNVRKAIFDLVDEVQEDDFALFYFSGHALPVLDTDDVYLVTHNFVQPHQGRGKFEISFKFLREELYEHRKAGCVVIILDCCYAGMFSDSAPDRYLEGLLGQLSKYFQELDRNSPSYQEGMRLMIAATGRTTANERDGHGLMTFHLLEALKGKVPQVANEKGQITYHLLAEYLTTALQSEQNPRFTGSTSQIILANYPDLRGQMQQSMARLQRLELLREDLSEPDDILKDRLERFVGRKKELEEVGLKIAALLPQGGYLVITSDAGQGKSSLIAKLVELAAQKQGGFDKVAHHFIRPELRSGGQTYLLRKLLSLLILKYDLPFEPPALSWAGEGGPALNDLFQLVLKEVVKRKGQEVIYIDGLDQLAIDQAIGQHDFNFLPPDLTKSPGIVFVLGTRRDNTFFLRKHKKPSLEYTLEELSRDDFTLLLEEYNVRLTPSRADLLYQKSGGHTLCLSVLTRELTSQPNLLTDKNVEEILRHIDSNPEQVFELSMNRLRLQSELWEKVSKPLLKLLLVAEEDLTLLQIRQLLNHAPSGPVDNDWLKRGLDHLGGLIVQQRSLQQNDVQQRYTLKHLMLRNYLDTFFSQEDQQEQHNYFVVWCGQEQPPHFWEPTHDVARQEQRHYARHFYVTHLYHARAWDTLFAVLDEGEYGRAKMLEDPSGRAYTQDLFWGQRAAASLVHNDILSLSRLWHYTFLRCSLTSRANNYSEATFRLLLLLGSKQERKATELAALLTKPKDKAQIFALIASHLAILPERNQEAFPLVLTIDEQMADSLPDDKQKVNLLLTLGNTLQQIGHSQAAEHMRQRACQISHTIDLDAKNAQPAPRDFVPEWLAGPIQSTSAPEAFPDQGASLAGSFPDVRSEAEMLSQERNSKAVDLACEAEKAEALLATILMLKQVEYWTGTEPIWREVWRLLRSLPNTGRKASVLTEFAFALERIGRQHPAQQLRWQVIEILSASSDEEQNNTVLTQFVKTLEQARYGPELAKIWQSIEPIIQDFSDIRLKDSALARLGSALARTGNFAEARRIISAIADEHQKMEALVNFALISRQPGRCNDAISLMNTIPTEIIRAEGLAKLSSKIRRAGSWEDAGNVINAIPDQQVRAAAWLEHAEALIQAEFFPVAERVLRALPGDTEQLWVLARLGVTWGQAEYRRTLKNETQDARRIISDLPDGPQKSWVLAELAAVFGQAQHWSEAEDNWRQAEQMAHVLPATVREDPTFSTHWHQASVHFGIALVQDKRWLQAEQMASDILYDGHFLEALAELAQKNALVEDLENIEWLISWEAQDTMTTASQGILRVYTNLGHAWKQKGNKEKATSIWQATEQRILAQISSSEQSRVLGEFARLLNETGNQEEADPLWQKAESMVLSEDQGENLVTLAMELGRAGREMEARRMLLSLENPWRKIQGLANLGTLAAQVGHREQIKPIWQKVAELLHEVAGDEPVKGMLVTLKSSSDQHINELILSALDLWQEGWQREAEQQFKKIEQLIQRISDETRKNETWLLLVEARGQTRNLSEVERLKEKFSPGKNRSLFLALYGILLGQAGRSQAAEEVISSILNESTTAPFSALDTSTAVSTPNDNSIDPIFKIIKDQALVKLAEVYWQNKSWKYAENIINTIHDKKRRDNTLAKQGEIMGGEYVIYSINSVLHQKEPDEYPRDLLANIRRVIASIKDDWESFQASIKFGESMANNGLLAEAREICEEVKAMVSLYEHDKAEHFSQEDKESKIELFSRLGIVFEHIGDRQKAENILEEVEKDILSLFHGTHKDQAFIKLANALAQANRWREAREVTDAIIDQLLRKEARFDLANLLTEAKLWEQAEKVVRTLPQDDELGKQARSTLDEAFAKAQEAEQAYQLSSRVAIDSDELIQTEGEVRKRIPRGQKREPSRPSFINRRALLPATHRAREEDELIAFLGKEWSSVVTGEQALEHFTRVCELIPHYPDLGVHLWNVFKNVDSFLEELAYAYTS